MRVVFRLAAVDLGAVFLVEAFEPEAFAVVASAGADSCLAELRPWPGSAATLPFRESEEA